MEIVSKIAKRILNHCSKCGGCPMAKIMDAQAETKNNTSSKARLEKESKMQA